MVAFSWDSGSVGVAWRCPDIRSIAKLDNCGHIQGGHTPAAGW